MNIVSVLIGVVAVIAIFIWFVYNDLIRSRMRVKEAWSQIDVQLKRRTNLIPNIVETVKGYAKHEKSVLENVTRARSALLAAKKPTEKASADNMLSQTLKTLFAVAESYPELKASGNFLQLQEELADTEDKVAYARQFYNKVVMDLNTKLQVFPNTLVAKYLGFGEKEFFKTEKDERDKPEVKFT